LPVLLQQGNKEIDCNIDVLDQLLRGLAAVSDSGTQAKNLLQLELNSGPQLVNLADQVFRVGDEGREFTGFVQTGGETRNLSDDGLGGKESIVLLGELLDELLVLVQLLQGINVHGVDSSFGGLLDVLNVSEHAHAELDLGDVGKFNLTAETLILLGVIVLKTNLELYSLSEEFSLFSISLLGLGLDLFLLLVSLFGGCEDLVDCCTQHVARDLAHCGECRKEGCCVRKRLITSKN